MFLQGKGAHNYQRWDKMEIPAGKRAAVFAPKVFKAQTKTPEGQTNRLETQRSTLVARPFGGGAVEQVHMLQRNIGNQATLRLLSQMAPSQAGKEVGDDREQGATLENMTARETALGVSWDFSKVPIFPPDRTQPSDAVSTSIPPAVFSPSPPKRTVKPPRRPSVAPLSVHETVSAAGRPLEPSLRREMSALFQFDFSMVRLHTDDRAAASAADIHALAYAAGPHIVFSQGAFQPSTQSGRQVLAHELAHVAEAPRIPSGELVLGDPQAAEEVSAERTAATIADRSRKAPHAHTYGPLVPQPAVGMRSLPALSVGMVRRINPNVPKLDPTADKTPVVHTPAEERSWVRLTTVEYTMQTWKSTYTPQTREATKRLLQMMENRELYVERLGLPRAVERRLQLITDRFFQQLLLKLLRKPHLDQAANVDEIYQKWITESKKQLDLEQRELQEELQRQRDLEQLKPSGTAMPKEPGDYPRPGDPLDLPQDKGEAEAFS